MYLGPPLGGGIENWFPYVLALLFLLVRPAGLFGERADRAGMMRPRCLRSLRSCARPLGTSPARRVAYLAVFRLPLVGNDYWFSAMLIPFLVLSLAALGLNLLTGYAGQLSLGSAAFMAVGAFAAYNFQLRVPGMPLLVSFALGGLTAAAVGVLFGLPSLRIKGFYLIVSTLAAQFFVEWALTKFGWFSNHNPSGVITAPPLRGRRPRLRRARRGATC